MEDLQDEAENLLLQAYADLKRRLEIMEDGLLGYYHPADLDEQRRAWIMEQFVYANLDIDLHLEQMHKADQWLKTGKLPRQRKAGTKEDEEQEGAKLLKFTKPE